MTQGRTSTSGFGWPLALRPGPLLMLVVLLVVACLGSALAVITASHQTRDQYGRLQQLEREQQQLQTEWGQLLLEHSTWGSYARVERVAREKLDMKLPRGGERVMVTP